MEPRILEIRNRAKKRIPVSLRNQEGKRGSAIVFHGLGGFREQRVVRTIANALTESGYRVVTFDAADGANAPDSDSLAGSVTGYLEDLEDVAKWVAGESWHEGPLLLAGHSLGALCVAEYAATNTNVERLILVAPAISWRQYRHVFPVGLFWYVRGVFRMPGPELKDYWLSRAWIQDFLRYDGYRTARRVHQPALIIAAGRDGVVGTVRTHQRYARNFPNAHLEVIQEADHDFHPHEEALAARIKQWLS